MKPKILSFAIIIVGLTYTAFGIDYKKIIAEGYRWVMIDGPYACTSQAELQRMFSHRNDATELHMVENLEAYYLIAGSIVRVLRTDPTTGISEIKYPRITKCLWTYSRFLSTRAIEDTYGVIETPETAGLIPAGDVGVIQGQGEEAMRMPQATPGSSCAGTSRTNREGANRLHN